MVVIRLKFRWREFPRCIWSSIVWKYEQFRLTVLSLTYNEHMSYGYTVDCFLEPIFWIVDNFAKVLGKVFVFCVVLLTSLVVFIAYWIGLPYWWERSPETTVFLVAFGNWLLLNIVFHYYMGVATSPGHPPHRATLKEAASICKKCISPKPARTHHCSVCDRCVLAMDHHCPWMNNCVGYFNARYFYLFMAYMVVGTGFVITAGFDVGYTVLWLNDTGGIIPNNDPDLIGHPVHLNKSGVLVPVEVILEYDNEVAPRQHDLPIPPVTLAQRAAADPIKRKAVVFMAVTCVAVFLALGLLTYNHGKNISRGESSIEAHINAGMRKEQPNFNNPYDLGRRKNWRLFLGLTRGRGFVRHVMLPSAHKPVGDGVTWHRVNRVVDDWP